MMKYGNRKHFATFVPMQIYNERFFTPRGEDKKAMQHVFQTSSTTHASSKRQKKMMVSLVAANSETHDLCQVAFYSLLCQVSAKGQHDLAGMTAAIKGS